jgi:AraC family transcriptional regulator of adaptative response / DNA-3-methyladenine glycosylase II
VRARSRGWSGWTTAPTRARSPGARSRSATSPRTVELFSLAARVRRLFDLDADPGAIAAHLGRDPRLRPHLRPGLRVPGAWDGFELAVRAVLGQQVSVAGATTLAGRLVARFGEPLADGEGTLTHLFPSPCALAAGDVSAIGLPRARAEAIRALAAAVSGGALELGGARELPATLATLGALPGFGPWTAAYVAMRAARDPDAFPAGDLGLRKALADGGELPSARAVSAAAERWRPWRAYAAMALWTSKGGER